MNNEKIGVVGLWHLGCSIAASWSKLGHSVVGVDYDQKRVADLMAGKPPLFEPGLEEIISSSVKSSVMLFTTDFSALRNCPIVFLAYDTPVREDDSCDTTILGQAIADIAPALADKSIVIVSSQTPVGHCQKLRKQLQSHNSSLELAYSPENLRLGEAIQCYLHPGRIILGTADAETERRCRALFQAIDAELLAMNIESAELVKHGINAFLATCIVFGNSLSDICERVGGSMDDVVRGLRSDPRVGARAYISPGTGFSGGTLGRDLVSLNSAYRDITTEENLFGTLFQLNQERTKRLFQRIEQLTGGVQGKQIGVWGITYKPGTSTLRRSLPLEIAHLLVDHGAKVKVFDPKADYQELESAPRFEIVGDAAQAAVDSEIVLLLTEWPEFKQLPFREIAGQMKQAALFDLKNCLDQKTLTACGFQYHSVGRGVVSQAGDTSC